jgi:uncharacterized cupredoxin-like copper-binding protein
MTNRENASMKRIKIAGLVTAMVFASIAGTAEANEGHEGHEGMEPGTKQVAGERVGGAWTALRATRDAIAADIAAGKLGEIHKKSEALVPQGQALLERSTDLAPEKRARVESALKQLPAVVDALHDAADAGKADEVSRQMKRLDGLLELVRAQYPPAALTTSTSEPDHAAMGHDMASHGDHGGGASMPGHAHATKQLAAVDAAAKSTIVVNSGEFMFEPKILELRAGEPTRIELVNNGKVEHAIVVAEPSGKGDWIHLHAQPGAIDAGTFQVDAPGRYKLLCTIPGHTEAGMVGELVVTAR